MKLILFDVDGTLVDSQSIIHQSMCVAFSRAGYDAPPITATRSIIGLTLDRAIATILNREIDDEVLSMTAEYKDAYLELAKSEAMQSQPFKGIPDLISKLAKRDDCLLGVVTGKSRRGVDRLLSAPPFENIFVTSRCADDCPSKPHPAMVLECCDEVGVCPQNTLVIGDTGFDMEMAKAAGATGIGVSWGYHPEDRIVSSGAKEIVHNTKQLENVLFHLAGLNEASNRFKPSSQFPSWSFIHA